MVDLSWDERELLIQGVLQWGGPAHPSPALAAALHVDGIDALVAEGRRVGDKLRGTEVLSDEETIFALVSTELNFASDRWGAGYEWQTVSGYSDAETIVALRRLQAKLVAVGVRPW
jgi:hypothetical protein